jgi:hypothetical protein
MNYTEIYWDPVSRITIIQVTGCVKTTSIMIPNNIVYQSPEYYALLEQVTSDVQMCLDPQSPTYDPTLVG